MPVTLNRRTFLKTAAGLTASLAGARAIEPFQRPGPARLQLGLAAYSFRNYLKDADHKRDVEVAESERLDLFQFIDFCAANGCAAAELTSYYFPPDVDRAFLLKIKRHAFLRGVEISGTAIGNTYTHGAGAERDKNIALTRKWIDFAQIMGAPHIRVFAGGTPAGMTKEQSIANCVETLREVCGFAAEQGIFLGIENHGGIVAEAEDLLAIIKQVNSPWLGINLDTGNFHTADPYGDIARCAPYAVNVQIKTEIRAKGGTTEKSDLARLVRILREANYQGTVALEFEEKQNPFKAVPGILQELKSLIEKPG